ncbi:MAG: hypothetical protein JW819_09685 [Candidatus Krumholzibacteriota bacterium]|nr:hypothetical protein [Candidatus Krumholzibacteriota bacterium]
MPRIPRHATTLPILAAILALAAPAGAARITPYPEGKARTVPVGQVGAAKDYYLVAAGGLHYVLMGPGTLSGYVKTHFAPGETEAKTATLTVSGLPAAPAPMPLRLGPSPAGKGEYSDRRAGAPSRGKRITVEVPAGRHEVVLATEPGGPELFVLLSYEGPAQPLTKSVAAAQKRASRKPAPPGTIWGWRYAISGALETQYDDNAFNYSSAYVNYFRRGELQDKFKVNTLDDVAVIPSLDVEFRRKLIPLGETRFRVKPKFYNYLSNPIKDYSEWWVYLRQYLPNGDSVELVYVYGSSKYLRQMYDRAPTASANDDRISEEFRFAKDNFSLNYRHKFNKTFSGTLSLDRNNYDYNKPNVESSLDTYDIGGTLYWTLSSKWRLTLDYSYRKADALGFDVAGETLENSEASDGTYERDYYKAGVRWRAPKRLWFQYLNFTAKYQAFYYTATGLVQDDSYHVGRKDNIYGYDLGASRGLTKNLDLDVGFAYEQRTVESPYQTWGDINEDKDYVERIYSIQFTYDF